MKGMLRSVFVGILALLARAILRKYRPQIVMVTGSVGKTSTKDAVVAALSGYTDVRGSEKSYNSELGVPFTIIGVHNPWSSPSAWFQVFDRAIELIIWKRLYPKLLVLEVGADRPGDLVRILRIAAPNAVVVTRLPDVPVHVEAYATPRAVREEEFAPAYALPSGAPLVISSRDQHAIAMAKNVQAEVSTFGFSPEAKVRLGEPRLRVEAGKPVGMETIATADGKEYSLFVPGVIGRPQVLAPAAALALALSLGVPAEDVLTGLAEYLPPPGRGRLLSGKSGSLLIDDSYNASPAAAQEALESLVLAPGKRKVAVLGDMLELGRYSVEEHERIGALAAATADMLIAVGPRSRAMANAAQKAGLPENWVHSFDTAAQAAEYLANAVQSGDAVLIKGSQSMRMERITGALLEDPADAKYLVRQEEEWKRR